MAEYLKTIREMSIESRLLMERLDELKVDEVVTYKELSELIGRDVQHEARGFLATARNRLRIDKAKIFGCVRSEGIKRLSDEGIVSTADWYERHMRRTARKAAQTLSTVDYGALSPELQRRHNVKMTVFAMQNALLRRKAQKAIEGAVAEAGRQIPTAKALATFEAALKR